jgi:hypothetical protein
MMPPVNNLQVQKTVKEKKRQQSAQEIEAWRELARRHLIDFAEYVAPWYVAGPHHILIAEYLEKVLEYVKTEGKSGIGRLIILVGPRYGKTEETSNMFPAFFLGNLPNKRVIITGYGAELAEISSRAVRNYILDNRYQALFGDISVLEEPVKLSEDSRSKASWDLAAPHRGGVVAAGIGGGITGKGAHLLIIDDPFKSRKDADSEAYRKEVISWYKSVAYQRLEKGAAVVIMHTRWHPDDLVGQLLKTMVSDDPLVDQWTVLCLPSMALDEKEYPVDEKQFKKNLERGIFIPYKDPLGRKPGEPLWPEKFDLKKLNEKRANADDFEWISLDQQMPMVLQGGSQPNLVRLC